MSPSSNSTAAADSDHGGATPFTGIHPDIIQSHILNRLDGPALAATSCASAELLSLCSGDHLWKDICNSTWPSTADLRVVHTVSTFPSGHRSFYSDAFPAFRHHQSMEAGRVSDTSELISAVDIYYDGALIYSKVLVTEARSTWFLSTPFRLELLDKKEMVALPLKLDGGGESSCITRAEEKLRVSWILIDPAKRRAVNVASRAAVEAGRHWLSDDIQLRYASVVEADGGEMVSCLVAVTCEGKEGELLRVKEVSMQVEETEGKLLTGAESLRILAAAMEGGRRRSDAKLEREVYESFLRVKMRCRERKVRRERGVDLACAATGISIFFAFVVLFLSR